MSKSKYIKWYGTDLHRAGFTLENYAGYAGEYPDTLILGSSNFRLLKDELLTEEGFEKFSQRIKIVVDDSTEHSEHLFACSGPKGYYCYNTMTFAPLNGVSITKNSTSFTPNDHMKQYGLEE